MQPWQASQTEVRELDVAKVRRIDACSCMFHNDNDDRDNNTNTNRANNTTNTNNNNDTNNANDIL